MCNRLGGLKRVAHHASVKVALVANAKARGDSARQRVAGNEVERRSMAAKRVVFTFVGASHEDRQAPRDLLPRRRFMTVGTAGGADRIRHDAAACHSVSSCHSATPLPWEPDAPRPHPSDW